MSKGHCIKLFIYLTICVQHDTHVAIIELVVSCCVYINSIFCMTPRFPCMAISVTRKSRHSKLNAIWMIQCSAHALRYPVHSFGSRHKTHRLQNSKMLLTSKYSTIASIVMIVRWYVSIICNLQCSLALCNRCNIYLQSSSVRGCQFQCIYTTTSLQVPPPPPSTHTVIRIYISYVFWQWYIQ